MRILVFSRAHASQYQDLEKRGQLAVDLLGSLDQVDAAPYRDRLYSGVLVDAPTFLEAQKGERDLLQELWDIFPVLLLEVVDGELRPLARQQFTGGLDAFLAVCADFAERPMRTKDRVAVHLHLQLAEEAGMTHPECTVTMNLGEQECFAITGKPYAAGTTLWVRFSEMADQTPIQALVCRQAPWGEGRYVPGVGLKFLQLSRSQQDFLKLVTLTS